MRLNTFLDKKLSLDFTHVFVFGIMDTLMHSPLFSRNKKLALFSLAIVAVVAVGVGFYQIYIGIYEPFKTEGEFESLSASTIEERVQSINSLLSLQTSDSDSDGISDYDELYTYKTSAYLKDTDSDGIDDIIELKQGSDPTCHKDKGCGETIPSSPPVPQVLPEFPLYLEESGELPSLPLTPGLSETMITPSDLRLLLEQSGFPKEQLNSLSDEELMETWKSAFGS